MATTPSRENRYILFKNGSIVDLLDFLNSDTDVDDVTIVSQLVEDNGVVIKAANSPIKLFSEVSGFKKTGELIKLGQTNWSNLFLIHEQFDYFMAFAKIDTEKLLVATSNNGIFWNFMIREA